VQPILSTTGIDNVGFKFRDTYVPRFIVSEANVHTAWCVPPRNKPCNMIAYYFHNPRPPDKERVVNQFVCDQEVEQSYIDDSVPYFTRDMIKTFNRQDFFSRGRPPDLYRRPLVENGANILRH
jgi:hypothetical protein